MHIKALSRLFLVALATTVLAFSACKKDEEDEEENINLIKVKIGANTFTWSDIDGPGGKAPVFDTIKLAIGTTYPMEVSVFDGSVKPDKDFTPEIIREKAKHLFVFTTTGGLTVSDLSKDANGKDFGQTATLKTTTPGTGTLRIVLKHEPDKKAANPAQTGKTDIDATYSVVVR